MIFICKIYKLFKGAIAHLILFICLLLETLEIILHLIIIVLIADFQSQNVEDSVSLFLKVTTFMNFQDNILNFSSFNLGHFQLSFSSNLHLFAEAGISLNTSKQGKLHTRKTVYVVSQSLEFNRWTLDCWILRQSETINKHV